MVVKHFYTIVTVSAMGCSRRPKNQTGFAKHERFFHIFKLLEIHLEVLQLVISDISNIKREKNLALKSQLDTLARNDARFSEGSEQQRQNGEDEESHGRKNVHSVVHPDIRGHLGYEGRVQPNNKDPGT